MNPQYNPYPQKRVEYTYARRQTSLRNSVFVNHYPMKNYNVLLNCYDLIR